MIVNQTYGVEAFTRMQQITILTDRAGVVGTVGLNSTHHQHVARQYGKDVLGVDPGRVAKVVWITLLQNLSINVEPSKLDDIAVFGQYLRGQAAQGSPNGRDSTQPHGTAQG